MKLIIGAINAILMSIPLWALIIWAFCSSAEASDLTVGILLGSQHDEATFRCNDDQRNFNESNPGLYVIYNGIMVGRYENSYSGCRGDYGSGSISDPEYSTMLGYQFDLGRWKRLEFSASAALVDGYPDEGGGLGEYRAWASINARLNLFGGAGVKYFYAYKAAAYAVEWR